MELNYTRRVLSTLRVKYKNFSTIILIRFTRSTDSVGDVSIGFMVWTSDPYVLYGAGYG